jgi:hypothetical protein
MANPGYPQMGHMQGNPMGPQPGMRAPMRRGTSKAVPVVVSAGLAVGVFCGLLFGLGTGKDEAVAATSSSSSSDKKDTKTEDKPKAVATTAAGSPAETKPPSAGSAAATTAAATPTASKPPTASVPKTAKLTVHIKPEGAAAAAKIVVDGKDIAGTSVDIPVDATGKKSVKVAVTATGYHSIDQKVDLEGDDTKLDIEMTKRGGQPAAPATGGTTPKTGTGTGATHPAGGKKPPKKPGGLIDI